MRAVERGTRQNGRSDQRHCCEHIIQTSLKKLDGVRKAVASDPNEMVAIDDETRRRSASGARRATPAAGPDAGASRRNESRWSGALTKRFVEP